MTEINYETIKEMAKNDKAKVTDYLVLSPTNDPFYVGSAGQLEKAKWFAKIYEKMGSPIECHIRRVHYWLVSQKPKYKKPDGIEYFNTENDWSFIIMAAKYARYANLIPIDNIIDKRNPAPVINAEFWENEVPTEEKDRIDSNEIIRSIVNKFYCFNPHNTQPYLIELWCEKSTMNDVLEPIAIQYGLNLVNGLGELSITAVHKLIERIKRADKPVRIFYISDFDPAGECMPVSVARKIEYFIREQGLESDVKLNQITLTKEQCLKYDLPRTPIKNTERRKEGFENKHGAGATELDALEALHEGELKKIIMKKIYEYFDKDLWDETLEKNKELKWKVRNYLKGKIGNVLEQLDISEFDKFELEVGEQWDDSNEGWIYDSNLNYLDQIESYNNFKRRHKE